MKRLLFLPVFLLVALGASAQMEASVNPNFIPWNQYRLSWNDFKAHPDHKVNADAVTSYSISIHPKFINGQKQLQLVVLNNFIQHESWVKAKSHNLLSHEQGHFDLAEVYVRKLRKELSQLTFSKHTEHEIDRIYSNILNELNREQSKYDNSSDYSRNTKEQRVWEKRIADQLKEYEAYDHPVVIINVD